MSDDSEQRLKMLEAQVQLLTRIIGVEGEDEAAHPLAHQQTRLLQAVERLAPIKALLEADEVNDILINADRSVYVERLGKLEKTRVQFENDAEVFKLAEEIVARIGRHINPQRPLVDARLPDGSRVNIIAPPLSVDGTMISIRKFSKRVITIDGMVGQENLSPALGEFLKVVGKCRLNIIVSGGTGSGKTTLLNAISQHIDPDERIVTIEDAAELKLQQPHVVRLESRPISFGRRREEEVTIRDLVKNALRMRPDRIIVGEVRGAEAFDMMQAMNTGHEGSLTTVHANHPRDAIARLENMINTASLGLSVAGMRSQIASAIHLIVQISRMRDGHRRITHISEVVGIEGEMITMQELFTFQTKGEDKDGKLLGEFRWSGIMPRFLRRVAYYGESERLAKALGVRLPGM
jgi:pilus assembly protein CpaF